MTVLIPVPDCSGLHGCDERGDGVGVDVLYAGVGFTL